MGDEARLKHDGRTGSMRLGVTSKMVTEGDNIGSHVGVGPEHVAIEYFGS